jgi:hypothetical protein
MTHTKHSTTGEREEIARIITDTWPTAGQTGHLRTKDLDPEVALALADAILSRPSRMAASSEGEATDAEINALHEALGGNGWAYGNWGGDELRTNRADLAAGVKAIRAMLAARPDAGREVDDAINRLKVGLENRNIDVTGARDPVVAALVAISHYQGEREGNPLANVESVLASVAVPVSEERANHDCLDNDTCPDCEGTGFADPASEASLCDRCDGFGHVPSSAGRTALNAQGADQ